MKKVKTKIRKLFMFFLLCILVYSCRNKSCEAFDIKRLPFDKTYFNQSQTYTNGIDTIKLYPKLMSLSKETTLDPISYPECNPIFEIEYSDKFNILDVLYSFDYSTEANDTITHLNIIINSSILKLNLDSLIENKNLNEEVEFVHFEQLNNGNLTRMIRRIRLKNMRISEILTYTGVKWKII